MLKKEVLVNGISNLSDARYCAGMFVDYLCFELNPEHKDYIPLEKVIEIKNWVSGPKIGGRVSDWPEAIDEQEWVDLSLDFLIISKEELAENAKEKVSELFFEVTKETVTTIDFSNYEHILCSSDISFNDITHSSLFIGGNVDLENLDEILENATVTGVALRGNHEERPGESKYEDLMDILEALEEED